MAPITSFTAQELWQQMTWQQQEFVFTGQWYQGLTKVNLSGDFDNAYWEQVLAVKNEVNRCIELARKDGKIKGSLQAEVVLYAKPELAELLAKLENELRFVLITSSASVHQVDSKPDSANDTELDNLWVGLEVSSAAKCSRCWHHREDVGSHAQHPDLCDRCVDNVDGAGESRVYA
jgi:isoleucyl-tRNA synthetase